MTLHLDYKRRATCPRHRGYDPARDGLAGIRGGCPICEGLLAIYEYFSLCEANLQVKLAAIDGNALQAKKAGSR